MADQTLKCGQCGKQLNSVKELREHEQTHTSPSPGQRQQAGSGQSQQASQGGQTR